MSRMNGWFEFKFSRPPSLKHVRTLKGGSNLSVNLGRSHILIADLRQLSVSLGEVVSQRFLHDASKILIRHKSLAVTGHQSAGSA